MAQLMEPLLTPLTLKIQRKLDIRSYSLFRITSVVLGPDHPEKSEHLVFLRKITRTKCLIVHIFEGMEGS